MTDILFAYGTLLLPGNKLAYHLSTHCTYLRSAKIKGALYDTGEYPGLVLTSDGRVCGHLYKISDHTLQLIDDYEGYGPGQDQPNLFLRVIQPVETANGITDAWVYLYNLPVKDLKNIPSGDYLDYIKQKIPRLKTGGL